MRDKRLHAAAPGAILYTGESLALLRCTAPATISGVRNHLVRDARGRLSGFNGPDECL
jgi:hypothetical protein